MLILSAGVSGQIIITGTIRDYHNQKILPFVSICADTTVFIRDKFALIPPETTNSNLDGQFNIIISRTKSANLTFSFMGYVSLTIKDINVDKNNPNLDLGNIYLPFRGQWIEGYRPPKGETKRQERHKQRREWRQEGIPNSSGFANDFVAPFQGKENIRMEYPLHGSNKNFRLQGECLKIDYEEFIKK